MVLLSVTCRTAAEAKRIGGFLVEQRLAACASWWPIQSAFRWKGRVEYGREVMLEIKTQRAKVAACRQIISSMHGYQLPVTVVASAAVDSKVTAWLKQSLK